ncbi:alpha/beta-Hydrolases superfamily protein [Striga asiatica]|uniref:Alpha/beta-Hydrolases superfamily protein n=1 Tax=Striga asiatica TaxID=4170 RepID=A0A5A7Q4S9_STRAF|nr:alpha/beta-Hydrolases superfamily protein [Striga asiatica]
MNEFNPGRSKPWNIYSSSNSGPTEADYVSKEGSWKSFGSSINAIYFGFVATAILISMFLIMAIFEHLFRPNEEESGEMESRQMHKLGTPQIAQTSYASDFSVVMPGQQYPTFIAQPAPLPCHREGVCWPSHSHQHILFKH